MQESYDSFTHDKKERKSKGILLVVVFLCLGLVLGIGSTSLYYFNQLEEKLESNINQQADLEEKLESLTEQLTSVGLEVEDLSYTTGKNEYKVVQTSNYSNNIQTVASTVMPSVVGVRTISIQQAASYFLGDSGRSQEVVGVGTGVIVSEDGLILTNQHVISDNPKSITVTLMDGNEYEASVIYSEESMDLAVIKIDETGLPTATLGNSDNVTVGEVTIAIGNPLGLEYERSVTAGIVSALDRSIQLSQYNFATNLIQTDAAINSGNSGGPLLNSQGEVIGINTYKLSNGEGMGFAVPINAAIPIIEQVIETGEFIQSRIGVSFIDTNIYDSLQDAQLEQLGLMDIVLDKGLIVLDIDSQTNAYTSGLEAYDILTHADGIEVDTLLELRTIIYSHLPGEILELTVMRGEDTITIPVVLSESNQ